MQAPGVDVRPLRQMNGDAHFTEVFLDDALVPDADRIGAAGEGWRVALTCLSYERGASAAGGSSGLLDVDRLVALARAPRPAATIPSSATRSPGSSSIERGDGLHRPRAPATPRAPAVPGRRARA